MSATITDTLAALREKFPAAAPRASSDHPAANIPATEASAALQFLRDTLGFDLLVDVTAIDHGADAAPRFTVVWHLLSTTGLTYFRLAADCADNGVEVPTLAQSTRSPTADGGIVVGYGSMTDDRFERGMQVLVDALEKWSVS